MKRGKSSPPDSFQSSACGTLDRMTSTTVPTDTEAPDEEGRLSVGEKVGYGLGDTASNLYWKIFEFFLMYFYTDVFGISAKSAGTMMLVTRIWDAINDPFVGYIADRTKTSWGRFRPYLVWFCVPFAIAGSLTFYTPDLGPTGKLIYAYVTYTLVMMVYTAINIPYGALMGVITPSSLERTSVSTYRFVLAFMGGIVVQYFTLRLVAIYGGVEMTMVDGVEKEVVINEQAGFFWTMVTFSIAAVILFLITFATTKERVQPQVEVASTYKADWYFLRTSLKLHQILLIGLALLIALSTGFAVQGLPWIFAGYVAMSLVSLAVRALAQSSGNGEATEQSTFELDFNDLLDNRPWMVLFGFGLFQLMGAFVRGGAILYYFKYYVGDASHAPAFFVSGSVAAIIGMLLTKPLTAMLGKKMLMIYMNVGVAISTATFLVIPADQVALMFAAHIAASFIGGPSPVVLWAMYADAADYSEWRNHRRATGLVFSAATFSQKMGCAVGAAMTGFALDYYQYAQPIDGVDQAQGETTMTGLRMMMSLIPAAFFLAAAVCLMFYQINEKLLQQIESELRSRHADSTQENIE
jgi:GPH family glycoside/pentoside/hexuronide:cation symporter